MISESKGCLKGTSFLVAKNLGWFLLNFETWREFITKSLSLIFLYRKLLSIKFKSPVKHDRSEGDSCSSTKNSFPISDACASTSYTAEKDLDISSSLFPGLTGEKQVRRSIYFQIKRLCLNNHWKWVQFWNSFLKNFTRYIPYTSLLCDPMSFRLRDTV